MKYKLIVFDIDGTIIKHVSSWRYIHERLELWDVLACKYQKIFLAGKISYRKFCELDAAHWKGMPEGKLKKIFAEVSYSKNALFCIKKLKRYGFKLAAVSTGLQFLAYRLKKELGFDYVLSNELGVRKGKLSGRVKINIYHKGKGKIIDKISRKFRINKSEIICVGDSAGDIPLAKKSGYSIAFNSSDPEYSEIVDYECKTRDFKEVYRKILQISGIISDKTL